jgi:hypothetical protein
MDLTTGDQPFQSPDGKIWMVCNGGYRTCVVKPRTPHGTFCSRGDIETIVPFMSATRGCHRAARACSRSGTMPEPRAGK